MTWVSLLAALGLERFADLLDGLPPISDCFGDPVKVATHLRGRGLADMNIIAEIVKGLVKLKAVRGRLTVQPPSTLDWQDVPESNLKSGDCFALAVLSIWWRGQVRATLPVKPTPISQQSSASSVLVISNNCWGGAHAAARAKERAQPYDTPFLGHFMFAPCYVTMLEHFDAYMRSPLQPLAPLSSRYGAEIHYPVATWTASGLPSVEVHFLHARSIEVAIATFERRRRRFLSICDGIRDHPDMLFKLDDRDGLTDDLAARFLALPFNRKLLILSQRHKHWARHHLAVGSARTSAHASANGTTVLPPAGVLLLEDAETPDGRVLEYGVGVAELLPLTELTRTPAATATCRESAAEHIPESSPASSPQQRQPQQPQQSQQPQQPQQQPPLLLSPPRDWPASAAIASKFVAKALRGKRMRLVEPITTEHQASIGDLQLESDDSCANAMRVRERTGWAVLGGFALFERADHQAATDRFVGVTHYWNVNPRGLWIDASPRSPDHQRLVLVESTLSPTPPRPPPCMWCRREPCPTIAAEPCPREGGGEPDAARLRLFALEVHQSVISDVRDTLGRIFGGAVAVDAWMITTRAFLFGEEEAKDVKHINARSWHELSPERMAAFRHEYASVLAAYDGFIVTHTLTLAMLYEPLGKPIVAVNTCRYDQPMCWTRDGAFFERLNECLAAMHARGQLYLVSNNKADAAYLQLGCGIESPCIPSLCTYTRAKYTGRRAEWVLMGTDVVPPSVRGKLITARQAFGDEAFLASELSAPP